MLKKLRLKFIIMSMSLTTLIMLIIFVAVYFMMRSVVISRSEGILDLAEEALRVGVYFKEKTDSAEPFDKNKLPETGDDSSQSEFERNEPEIFEGSDLGNERYIKWMFDHVITVVYSPDGTIMKVDMPIEAPELEALKGKNVSIVFDGSDEKMLQIGEFPFRYRRVDLKGYGVLLLISSLSEFHDLDSLLSVLTTVGAIAFLIRLALAILMSGKIIAPAATVWERQKTFVADASHELKTPITVISATLDVIKQNPSSTVEEQKKWFDNIEAELGDMEKLVSDMLSLARLDAVESDKKIYGKICLSDVVTEAGLVSESRVIELGTDIDLSVEEDIYINGDEREIKQVVMILLDNAIKNTPVGGKINLMLKRCKGEAVIVCKNTGEGIPDKELKAIFGRFYRSDSSRARITGGSGLGLAIAKGITEAHMGRIYAESELHEWTKFTVRLPIYK